MKNNIKMSWGNIKLLKNINWYKYILVINDLIQDNKLMDLNVL